ncbi:MAG TPA: CocE/NonD family hydrolase [Gaiellaceae bacterium]|nr:CocE/NonD family hydrolase [Gaiellaceae bacterium]
MSTVAHPTVESSWAAATRVAAALCAEVGLARLGFALIALHVVDDNFLQPEPGVSAADHAVSGLVPLAVLVAAAAGYDRLRAGLRGALALLVGFLGLLGGSEAAYYASEGALSGDDYTGFLSVAGGLLLLGVGTVALWRSRRRDDSRLWRYPRRALLAVVGVLIALFVLFPVSLAYVVTHAAPVGVPAPNIGAAYEDVQFTTSDGLLLKGWYVPSKNGAAVISFPGRSGTRLQARMLARRGYGVLLFDRRGEGVSEGDWNAFGWQGERDLHAAVRFLQDREDVDPERIGGIGRSVGGEMLIEAAAESDAFKAVVSEGASGRSVRDELANHGFGPADVPNMATQAVLTAATAIFTNNLPPADLKSLVPRIAPSAVFFVYGEHGQGGSERAPNRGFYAAAGQPKEIWEVPGAQHVGGITERPAEYERRVIAFFDAALRRE